MLSTIWNTLLIQPLTASLIFLNSQTGNLGLSIIILTIGLQFLLTPLRLPSLKSAQQIRKLQPHINKLKDKHKKDKVALAQAQMELYREHGVSPLGGILPTLLSIPIIIALYQVLLKTLEGPSSVSIHLGWLDLTTPDPYYLLPILVGVAQFLLSRMMMPAPVRGPAPVQKPEQTTGDSKSSDPDQTIQAVQSQMKYIFPIMSGGITATLPAGVGLYWLTSVSFAIIQQLFVENGSTDAPTPPV